ncbi:MAG TPA: YdiU family protein [Thermoanaerobaculia bacterium]|nr:YdiU family protein [Thermoanaerobaculia bacterium]
MIAIPFNNSYARLPQRFFTRTKPTAVDSPRLIRLNTALAVELGLDPESLGSEEAAAVFAGNQILEGSEPIATGYAGHQFGSFVPQLGDGRAILLGEVIDRSGVRRDIQLKGAGRTPWSRGGDGRAAVGPVLREYVVSEAMHALGIRTTRALAAVTTGQPVIREEVLPGAILTRVASSHIRVGTFQYFASRGDMEGVQILADHVIARHYPDAANEEQPYRALLAAVCNAQAALIADWLLVGFIHGVMNTDNMSIAGETIDYGPCAFVDEYDPATVFSSIDRMGRYAYGNQPGIGAWNLTRLAECLLPLISEDPKTAVAQAEETLGAYIPAFERRYHAGLRRKFGFLTEQANDIDLAQDLMVAMRDHKADFTLTFRALCDASSSPDSDATVERLFNDAAPVREWLPRWRERLAQEPSEPGARSASMRRANPAFIPRNHRVEAVIRAAADEDDFAPFEQLVTIISRPYEEQPEFADYMQPPHEDQRVLQTFCGT